MEKNNIFETLKYNSKDLWKQYTEHKFVNEICDGSLKKQVFKYYLIQDYIFLIEYSKAWAVAFQSTSQMDCMSFALLNMKSVFEVEIYLHLEYCKKWNILENEILKTQVHKNTKSYTDYVMKTTKKYGYIGAIVSMAPCCIGYAEIGSNINLAPKIKDNPFQSWIDMYAGDELSKVAKEYKEHMDKVINTYYSDFNFEVLQEIFNEATRLEVDFWDMAYLGSEN